MRPALYSLGLVGALLALLACVLVTAPLRVDGLPGSTVKILAGGGHGSGVHIGDGYIISAALGGMYPSLTGFGFMVPAAAVCDLMGKRALA